MITIPASQSREPAVPARPRTRRSARQHALAVPENCLRDMLEGAVSDAFAVPRSALRHPTRGCARIAFARQVAMYLAHVAWGLRFTDIGRILERDRTTVAYACELVEDRRDDPTLDRTLDLLTWALNHLRQRQIAGTDDQRSSDSTKN